MNLFYEGSVSMKYINRIFRKGVYTTACGIICLICLMGVFSQPSKCSAEIIEAMAEIKGGNVSNARDEAMRNGMREFVESKVGIFIDSTTEVDMGVIISDKIVSQSTGYVQIKKIISEGQRGNCYYVKMDLAADDKKIELKYQGDVKSAMEATGRNGSRGTTEVAVVGIANDGTIDSDKMSTIVAGALVENGVQNVLNGKLSNFMSTHRNPSIAETRQAALASKRKEASSVVCGRIEDIGIDKVDGGFMAKVEVTLQWIGLENNYADPYSEYFTYVSPNMDIAVREARKKAANEAALVLCQRALKTMQFENQGGQKHIVTELHIYGMSPAYEMQLMNLLEGMNCDFDDDYGFDPNGVFKVSFEVTGYKNVGDFRRKLAIAAQGIGMNLSNLKSDATDFDPMIQLRVI